MSKKTQFWRLGVLTLALLVALSTAGCGGKDKAADAGDAPEEAEPSGAEENGDSAEPASEPEPEPVPEPEPEPEPETEDLEEDLNITLVEALDYVRNLEPSRLGLEGKTMDEYEVIAKNYIVPIDGLLCSELLVYNKNVETGTNELVETVFISRGEERKLYCKDDETSKPVELSDTVNG